MRNSHPKVNIRTTLSEMVHSSDARHLPREAFNDPSLSCRPGAPRTAGEVREPRRGMILLSWADRWPGRKAPEAGDPYESLRAFAATGTLGPYRVKNLTAGDSRRREATSRAIAEGA